MYGCTFFLNNFDTFFKKRVLTFSKLWVQLSQLFHETSQLCCMSAKGRNAPKTFLSCFKAFLFWPVLWKWKLFFHIHEQAQRELSARYDVTWGLKAENAEETWHGGSVILKNAALSVFCIFWSAARWLWMTNKILNIHMTSCCCHQNKEDSKFKWENFH